MTHCSWVEKDEGMAFRYILSYSYTASSLILVNMAVTIKIIIKVCKAYRLQIRNASTFTIIFQVKNIAASEKQEEHVGCEKRAYFIKFEKCLIRTFCHTCILRLGEKSNQYAAGTCKA